MRFNKPQNRNGNSTVEITKVINEWVDEDGVLHRQVSKDVTNDNKPLNFGSVNKPKNPSIIHFKITIPEKISEDMPDFFRMFRGG